MPVASLLPLLIYFLIGVLLRATGAIGREHSPLILRLVFLVTLPALAFLAVADANLTPGSAWLPVTGFAVNVCTLGLAWAIVRRTAFDTRNATIVVLGASIANMVFIFPFVLAALGPSALADAVLIDLGNAVFVATVANGLAMRSGHRESLSAGQSLLRVLRTPLFIALLAAIILNLGDLRVPQLARDVLAPLGAGTIPLTLIALGLALNIAHLRGSVPLLAVACRMGIGLLAGLAAIAVFGFEGGRALVVIVSAAAPVGFNAVTLAAVGGLDTEKAAAAVSLSVLIGIVTTVALLWLGRPLVVAMP